MTTKSQLAAVRQLDMVETSTTAMLTTMIMTRVLGGSRRKDAPRLGVAVPVFMSMWGRMIDRV